MGKVMLSIGFDFILIGLVSLLFMSISAVISYAALIVWVLAIIYPDMGLR